MKDTASEWHFWMSSHSVPLPFWLPISYAFSPLAVFFLGVFSFISFPVGNNRWALGQVAVPGLSVEERMRAWEWGAVMGRLCVRRSWHPAVTSASFVILRQNLRP